MLKNPKGSLFQIFRHCETAIKISHFLFSNFFIKDSKEPPSIFPLAISKCYGKVRVFFPRDNSLVSDRKSHNSDFFGLAVRCLLFNPEGPGSNPCLCANFFYKIFEAEDSHFFRQYETPPPPFRLFETYFRKFLTSPKGPPFIFFDILQQNER